MTDTYSQKRTNHPNRRRPSVGTGSILGATEGGHDSAESSPATYRRPSAVPARVPGVGNLGRVLVLPPPAGRPPIAVSLRAAPLLRRSTTELGSDRQAPGAVADAGTEEGPTLDAVGPVMPHRSRLSTWVTAPTGSAEAPSPQSVGRHGESCSGPEPARLDVHPRGVDIGSAVVRHPPARPPPDSIRVTAGDDRAEGEISVS